MFYRNYLVERNTADMTVGKPIAAPSDRSLRFKSGLRAVNPLVAFYDIHGRKREVSIFHFVPDSTREIYLHNIMLLFQISNLCDCTSTALLIKLFNL
jgi:hypothetical protein